MKTVNICHHNTTGLYNDSIVIAKAIPKEYKILFTRYEEKELYNNTYTFEECDVMIFIEHIHINCTVAKAKKVLFFPNIEWLAGNDIRMCKTSYITHICCKNKWTYEKLSKHMNNCILTKFSSLDLYNPNEERKDECVHVKGVSKYKNTQIVLDEWMKHPEWPLLHLIQKTDVDIKIPIKITDNIILYQTKLKMKTLKDIMNRCKIHICPSYAEGYGHYINEARSCDAYIITIDGNPMNEMVKDKYGYKIKVKNEKTIRLLTKGYCINGEEFSEGCINVFDKKLYEEKKSSREEYKKDTLFFEEKIKNVVYNNDKNV